MSAPAITQLLLGGRAAGTELRLISVPEATSTNDVLADIWERTGGEASQNPALSTLVTYAQTAGVGRHGREWISPRGKCLAASTLVRLVDDEAAPREPRNRRRGRHVEGPQASQEVIDDLGVVRTEEVRADEAGSVRE